MNDLSNIYPSISWDPDSQMWEDGDFPLTLIDRDPEIQIHVLGDPPPGDPTVGFARGKPSVFEVSLSTHETVFILEGTGRVEVDGRLVELAPGVATTFKPGCVARWTIDTPIRELFVMSAPVTLAEEV
ncbi:cupin domain-containing protein [Nocardioides sambongensis]|uniref:cupin domain-containing protein n=1 Tax=Nocardioides sambongensis TaxID=2589074 RepID=UPI00112DF12E|nr:cupin domain-containing protein [Nocardioides sambongensis]